MFWGKFKTKAQKAEEAAQAEAEWKAAQLRRMPMAESFWEKVTVEPVARQGTVVAMVRPDADAFQTTAASQWSTADAPMKRTDNVSPLAVTRDHSGHIRKVQVDLEPLRDKARTYKWLIQHPDVARANIKRHFVRKQRIEDSALFL